MCVWVSVQVRIANGFLVPINISFSGSIIAYWADNYHNGRWTMGCACMDTNNEFAHKTVKHTAKEGGGGPNVLKMTLILRD